MLVMARGGGTPGVSGMPGVSLMPDVSLMPAMPDGPGMRLALAIRRVHRVFAVTAVLHRRIMLMYIRTWSFVLMSHCGRLSMVLVTVR